MFLSSVPRIARLVLALVVLIFVLAVAAVGTLFYVLDEKAVKDTIDTYAKEALNASVEYGGPIELKHLTSLHVQIPSLRFVDLESGETVGSIAGAQAEVALWSSLLGAVNVKTIAIDGAQFSLSVPRASGDALLKRRSVPYAFRKPPCFQLPAEQCADCAHDRLGRVGPSMENFCAHAVLRPLLA